MINLKIITTIILLFGFMLGCSDVKYLGAIKYGSLQGFYVERWYLNPKYKVKLPRGTAFYRETSDKMRYKFIIKYYIKEKGGDSTIEIPKRDMWKIKRKDHLYIKTADQQFIKSVYAPGGLYDLKLIPIKECYGNGWCKLYPTYYNKDLYIKRSKIYRD